MVILREGGGVWCACNGPFAESGVIAKIVAVASEGVEIGVVHEVGDERKEFEKRAVWVEKGQRLLKGGMSGQWMNTAWMFCKNA